MTNHLRANLHLETLESRETPVVAIISNTTATFLDIDGDKVTIKVSSGDLHAFGVFDSSPKGLGDQLHTINFSAGGFDGVNLNISVTKVATGDGLVDVGYINSTGHDLGNVSLAGDLGQIDAGDSNPTAPAVKVLNVRSMGRYGTDTQSGVLSLQSNFNGALGKLTVKGDVVGAYVNVSDGVDGTIGSVTIGGSLIGGSGGFEGNIFSSGNMGVIKIGHDVQGGAGIGSAQIRSLAKLAGVTVGGSLFGGSGADAGEIRSDGNMGVVKIGHDMIGGDGPVSGSIVCSSNLAGVIVGGSLIGGSTVETGEIRSVVNMGPVKIGRDMIGRDGNGSGRISCNGELAGATVGGSIIGGLGGNCGEIVSADDMGPVKIGHNLVGANISGITPSLTRSGYVESGGRLASISVGGSVVSGIDSSTAGTLRKSGSIRAGDDIGLLTIKGSLLGNANPNGDSPAIITARGQAAPGTTTDVAIGKLKIGGRVENAQILAGYDTSLFPVNADAQIGSVTIGGDWVGSSIAAGVDNGGDGFGNGNDVAIAGGAAAIVSRIGSITIKGLVYGTPGAVADHFGFVAQQIGSFRAPGFTAALTAGTDAPQELALTTGDVTIREVL